MKFLYIIIGFVLGFIVATYWQGGRDLVKGNAPVVQKQIKKGVSAATETIKDNL